MNELEKVENIPKVDEKWQLIILHCMWKEEMERECTNVLILKLNHNKS